MSVAARMEAKLRQAFAPSRLEIVDESHLHAGHAGARPGGETHFRVIVVAAGFEGLSRVARQRLVHQVLAEDLASQVHALGLVTRTPAEDADARAD